MMMMDDSRMMMTKPFLLDVVINLLSMADINAPTNDSKKWDGEQRSFLLLPVLYVWVGRTNVEIAGLPGCNGMVPVK